MARDATPLKLLADLVVFLAPTTAAAADRKARLDDLAGRALLSDAAIFVGTPDELAAELEAWRAHGLDGFRLRPGVTTVDLPAIVDGVVPALQQRGVFRRSYEPGTLRERFGLGRPANRYARSDRMTPRKQVILGAHFPGVNNTSVWSDPTARSQIEFDSFVHLAQSAERGRFDFFFLAEGLRLREQRGRIHDLDVVGRPDTLAVLTAIAAVTDHLGLIGTLNATYHEVYELARQLATLDHLSNGRAGWNVVTSSDAFTGENFRRGGFLDYDDRYIRAGEFIRHRARPVGLVGPRRARRRPGERAVRAPRTARARSTSTASSSTCAATSRCRAARSATR